MAGGPLQTALLNSGCVEYLVSLLDSKNPTLVQTALHALERLSQNCSLPAA